MVNNKIAVKRIRPITPLQEAYRKKLNNSSNTLMAAAIICTIQIALNNFQRKGIKLKIYYYFFVAINTKIDTWY
jgi:hypothetical protein